MSKLGAILVVCAVGCAGGEVDGQSVPDGKGWTRKLTFVENK